MTPEYTTSENCKNEIAFAAQLGKTIVPILFNNVIWPVEGPMAITFAQTVYIKCPNGLTKEKLERAVKTVADHVAQNRQ